MKRSPIVYFLFFFSGVTALIYEIIWTRMLTLTFGHTVFSVSVVLAAFMAGLGFGSYLFGHAIDKFSLLNQRDGAESGAAPEDNATALLVYGWVEILIFISCALLSLFFTQFSAFYSWLHQWLPESAVVHNIFKAGFAFSLMFIPATLMGATLPVMTKYFVTEDNKLGSQVGFLYALNTIGAAMGCLLTGFLLISLLGVLQTVLMASAVNLFIGISAIRIYQDSAEGAKIRFTLPKFTKPAWDWTGEQKLWMAVSFLCGLTALAYEILWTRLLVFSISSTVYSLSMMLAVFLIGIFLGSLLAAPLIKRVKDLRAVLIVLQVGIGLYAIGEIYGMEAILSAPWNSYNLKDPAAAFSLYFMDSAGLMLLPTIFLGMSFPILIRLIARGREEVGRATGQIYAANTLGAIFGSLLTGFLILPGLGSQASLTLIATINLLLAALLFRTGPYLSKAARNGLTVAAAALILVINVGIPKNLLDPFFMRDSAGQRNIKKLLYFEEGLTDTVAVFEDNYGMLDPTAKRLITNGISMSASNKIASRYMKLFAHVPILLAEGDELDVLVVCFGTGQTTGAAGLHPRVRAVDSLELSSSVIRAGKVFAGENHDVLENPKVNIVIQDGRNHLLTTGKRYDVITAEPPPPRTAFTVNLYTQEYYELTRKQLKPGGIVAQWIPLHSQGEKEVSMHIRTFLSVFPHSLGWISVANEILIIGSDRPIRLDLQTLKQRFEDPAVLAAMREIEVPNVYSFLSNLWFLEDQLNALGEGYPIISDNRPSIEFYLDLGAVIGTSGREKFVFNRAPFADIAQRIESLTYEDEKKLRRHYRIMDLYQRGVMYGNRGQLLEALSLDRDSDLIRYHLQAGREQIRELNQRLKENPQDIESLLNLGHTYYQVGEYSKSAEALKRVLELDPGNGFANLYLGYNLQEIDPPSAKAYFEAAVKEDPRQLRSVMREIAFLELLEAFEQNPEDAGLLHSLAQFYNMKSEYGKALKYSLKALDQDPDNIKALQSIVFSYRGLGEASEALEYGNRYNMLDPNDIHLQYILGEMYAKTLRCEKAIPYLEAVLQKDDGYQNAKQLLNECGKPKNA